MTKKAIRTFKRASSGQLFAGKEHYAKEVLTLMPLDNKTYQANAKKCEDRAKDMPPELRRDLLMAARHWRKLASVADKRDLKTNEAITPGDSGAT